VASLFGSPRTLPFKARRRRLRSSDLHHQHAAEVLKLQAILLRDRPRINQVFQNPSVTQQAEFTDVGKYFTVCHFTFWISNYLGYFYMPSKYLLLLLNHRQQNIKFSRLHTDWDFPLGKCPQFSRA